MILLSHCVAIVVPDACQLAAEADLDRLTHYYGGCTKTRVRGEWYGSGGIVSEEGTRYEWRGKVKERERLNAAIVSMLEAGQEAVFVEFGHLAAIFDKSDFKHVFGN